MWDATSLWLGLKNSTKWVVPVVACLLLFIAGFQLGRVTSPYYASHPIIFTQAANQDSGGSREELVALQEAGTTKKGAVTSPVTSPPGDESPEPTVAGTQSQAKEKAFVGSVNSDLYHHPDCPSAKRIKEENQIWFASVEEAEAAGYSPSQCTQDRLKN